MTWNKLTQMISEFHRTKGIAPDLLYVTPDDWNALKKDGDAMLRFNGTPYDQLSSAQVSEMWSIPTQIVCAGISLTVLPTPFSTIKTELAVTKGIKMAAKIHVEEDDKTILSGISDDEMSEIDRRIQTMGAEMPIDEEHPPAPNANLFDVDASTYRLWQATPAQSPMLTMGDIQRSAMQAMNRSGYAEQLQSQQLNPQRERGYANALADLFGRAARGRRDED